MLHLFPQNIKLPSILRACLLHSDASQLADKFLAASANRLSEFGEGAAALQVTESVLARAALLRTGPAGMTIAWRINALIFTQCSKTQLSSTHCKCHHKEHISTWCCRRAMNRNDKSTLKYMMISAAVLYLLQIQTPFRVLWSGFLCKVIQPVCISPA